nr:ribonuclease H-like domain-containing protein [Tanacetum cinerariifolium]
MALDVRYDNGTEFVNNNTNELFSGLSIVHQTSCAYTPQQNEVAERKHTHLLNMARILLFQSGLPLNIWTKCILTAAYLINRLPSFVLNGKSPFELVYGLKPKLSHLRSFGCRCYSYVLNNSDKFSARSTQTFDGSEYNIATSMGENTFSEGIVPSSSDLNAQNLPENISQVQPDLRRSGRNVKLSAKFNDYALNKINTWTNCDLPEGRKAVWSKWLFKIKYKSTGAIDRYKARLVAKGFSQRDLIIWKLFVVKMSIVRCLLNVDMCNNWDLFQLDINNAFLYGGLSENVYMTFPPGFDNQP